MESFLSRFKNVLVLIAVLMAQLLLLAVQVRRPTPDANDRAQVSLARSVVTTLITPPERVIHATGEWFRGLWFGYVDLIHVRRDNKDLQSEIERLQLEQASLSEDARQGQRLQKLLDFRQQYIYKTLPAQVIGTSGTDQSRVLYIDKGADDGLVQDMPVVTGDGIVGRVKDIFDHSAQVLLISDPTSGVGVILEKTRTRGVLKGTFNGQPQIINVSPDERIQPGDRILTSGGDQIFPRGLPVGTVDRVATDPDRDPLVDVTIHPAANLSRLEEVLVITNVGDTMSPQSAKDLAASEAEGEAAQKRASDILSERLPSKLDPNAPADTNPDANSTASGPTMRPIPPPKNLHADQYTPGSVPPATELTPGERLAPIRKGTEEIPAASKPKPAGNATTSATAGSVPHSTNAASGVAERPAGTPTTHAVSGMVPGAVNHPATTTTHSTTPFSPHNATPGAVHTTVPGSSPTTPRTSAPVAHPATGENTLPPAGQTHPVTTAPGSQSRPHINVIVDGPVRSTAPKPAEARPATSARPASEHPAPEHSPATHAPPQEHRKGPSLVPDDGSRPPSERKKTQTTTPPGGN